MKKIIALTLALLLALGLFAGCSETGTKPTEKAPAPTEPPASAPDTQKPAPTDGTPAPTEPAPSEPASTEPASTEPSAPADDADAAEARRLLKEAVEKMGTLDSLAFSADIAESISTGEGEEAFSMEVTFKSEGTHTAEPNATYTKGSMSMFGMNMPVESYNFLEGKTQTSYSWDDSEGTFLRTVTELEDEETNPAQPVEIDYDALELTAKEDAGECVITINATIEEVAALMQASTGFLGGSDVTGGITDFGELGDAGELKDVRVPLIFRVDPNTGWITAFALDLEALYSAAMEATGESQGQISGYIIFRYSDFNAVAPITAPEDFKDYEEDEDWEDWEDWEDDWGAEEDGDEDDEDDEDENAG